MASIEDNGGMPDNIFSIDVEEWFHIMEHTAAPPESKWPDLKPTVEHNLIRLFDICAEHKVVGTCFFLGWVARRYPHLVREASIRGFEIASHGISHIPVYKQSPGAFFNDISESKKILEDISGKQIYGYRAAGFSITERTDWAFEKIIEAGFLYDSSVFPAKRAHGGYRVNYLKPHKITSASGHLIEFPISTANILGTRFYFFGGGYFRLFPYSVVRMMANRVIAENRPVIVYIHPREIDPGHPRLKLGLFRNFKSYINLGSTEFKLRRLFEDLKFGSFREWLNTPC